MRALSFIVASLAAVALGACDQIDVPATEAFRSIKVGERLTRNLDRACIADYDPAVDYFPAKVEFKNSAQLKVSYHRSYKRVTFTPTVDTREVISLVLVQCGAPTPPIAKGEVLVHVPVARFATSNATMLGAIEDLGLSGALKGVPNRQAVSVPAIVSNIERGSVLEVGSSTHSNIEYAMALQPQLLFTFYSAYPQSNVHRQLQLMGIPAVPLSDHTETSPLGRAEWLKYVSLFFNVEERANSIYAIRSARYLRLSALARKATRKPIVLAGYAETRDDWLLPGGNNFLSRLIEDSGGQFFNAKDRRAGTLNYVPMEVAYDGGSDAELWIGYTQKAPTSSVAFKRENPKLGWLKLIQNNRMYWLDRGKTGRRNPYLDQSMARPDSMLADFVVAIHPDLLPSESPSFLRQIERGSP